MAAAKRIYVYENWMGTEPFLMGCLYAESLRGKEIFSSPVIDHGVVTWKKSDRIYP